MKPQNKNHPDGWFCSINYHYYHSFSGRDTLRPTPCLPLRAATALRRCSRLHRPKTLSRVLGGFDERFDSLKRPRQNKNHPCGWFLFWRRRRDSNPRTTFRWLHDFQSCALDQLRDFSIGQFNWLVLFRRNTDIITTASQKIKYYFSVLRYFLLFFTLFSFLPHKFQITSCILVGFV